MIGPIKRYTSYSKLNDDSAGYLVLHADHLASHQYDEAKERAAFEAEFKARSPLTSLHRDTYGRYIVESVQSEWAGWLRCAKSRAKAAGCE